MMIDHIETCFFIFMGVTIDIMSIFLFGRVALIRLETRFRLKPG